MSFAKQVWETLSAINVNENVDKKGTLSYLSWAWAWGTLMENYPESNYSFREPVMHTDSTCEVWVDLTIQDGDQTLVRSMWLPCMDNRNNAIANPDMRKISDTRMRCLTKCISMFGLGHYIYAGEDLPSDEVSKTYSTLQKESYDALIGKRDGVGLWSFRKSVGDLVYTALYDSFAVKTKMTNKAIVKDLEEEASNRVSAWALEFAEAIDNNESFTVQEFAELDAVVKKVLYERLTPEQQHKLAEIKKEVA